MANNKSNDTSTDEQTPVTDSKPAYIEGGRKRKTGPRRNGKGSVNSQRKLESPKTDASESVSENNSLIKVPEVVEAADMEEGHFEDDAAISEGGLKAVGAKRIIPFMKLEKPMAIFSILMIVISLAAIFINGLNLGLDFTGGVSADIKYDQPVEQVEVLQTLEKSGFSDPVVQYLGGTTELLVRLPPQSEDIDGLSESLNAALDLPNNNAEISNVNIIGSQIGDEVYLSSIIAIVTALGMMLLYVGVRFQFKLAIGALLALFHDAIVTIGIFALFQFPFDLTVLAAILALIGYSLNDTIVVYDRIRENFRRVRGAAPKQVIDLSLTETLRRTIMTVSTVLVVVLAMLFLGGAGLYWFSVAFLIGLVAGTYSSTYISSTIPLAMGLSRDDFVVKIKPEFQEEVVSFNDPKFFEE